MLEPKKRALTLRERQILALHLEGASGTEIAKRLGIPLANVYKTLARREVQEARSEALRQLDREFEALYGKVINTLREALESEDPRIRLEATNQWFKASGKYREGGFQISVSAEDIIMQVLRGKDENTEP